MLSSGVLSWLLLTQRTAPLGIDKIRLTGGAVPPNLPLGAGGTVAIYTDHGKPVHIISKVAIRIKKWLLYVLPTVNKP